MFPNKKPGNCAYCGAAVGVGNGWAFRPKGWEWQLSCDTAPCLALVREAESRFARKELTADGQIFMPYDKELIPTLRALPGARWDAAEKCWRVSVMGSNKAKVLEVARSLGLDIAPELTADEDPRRKTLVALGLYPYQADGVLWLRSRARGLLADSMGLGKTPQALIALPEQAACLVVCPASLKYNWADECARWRPDLTPTVLSGKGSFRVPQPGELLITNYDLLPSVPAPKKGERLAKLPPEHQLTGAHLVVDEATMAQNRKAARTRAIIALQRSAGACWFLSGTPMMNRPLDLWGLLNAAGIAQEAFGGWPAFVKLFDGSKNKWGGLVFGRPSPETPGRLRRVMLRRLKEEVLPDLPAVRWARITTGRPDNDLARVLDDEWSRWRSRFEADELPPFEALSRVRAALAASRVEDTIALVEQYEQSETPLLVFSAHRAPIDALRGREGWAVITGDESPATRHETVLMFQEGHLKGVGLTIRAGGYGLTLTRASHVLFVDLSWVPAENAQAVDRVRRIGQKADSILVSVMVSDHALDRRVHEILRQKQTIIEQAIEQPEKKED